MIQKSITDSDYENLKNHLGKEWADWVTSAADAQGKALENSGLAFKMPMPPSDEDEDKMPEDEDEDDDNPFPPKKSNDGITQTELLLFSSVKQLSEMIHGYHGESDEIRKEVKDGGNQLAQLREKMGDIEDSLRRIEQYFGQLVNRQPASKSSQTIFNGNDPLISEPLKKNHEGESAPVPVFNQMKQGAQVPTIIPPVNTD